jgi:lipopolysaccharide/colanic/teichoic acid biosynthesis glycosyltransferase
MGLDGTPFLIVKFRTMVPDAEELTGPRFAIPNDPRTTRLGAWLRRFSLDELPQLLNVLRGDMSLVGPRPERPEFVARFRERYPEYMSRHRVRAGITGWAQVHDLRGNSSIRKRIAYDLYYIDNWSLALDFKILWLTVLRFWRHRHAY